MAEKGNWQPKPEYGERQYRRIDTRVWNDRRFRSFTAAGRTVWLFLLTNPRTTSIPGLFPLHEEEAARMCGLTLEGFREGFAQPFREGMVEADWGAGLVWLKNAARYEPPTGPNVVAAWRRVARMSLPECPLLWRALLGIREQLREVMATPEPFLEAFGKGFREPLGDGFPEPFAPTDDGDGCRKRMPDDGLQKPSAVAAAPPGGQGVLAVVPDPPAAEKPKPPRKQPDGEHHELWRALEAEYARVMGHAYAVSNAGADASAVKWLREVAKAPPEEAVRRWGNLLEWSKGGFPSVTGFASLRQHWNAPQVNKARASTLDPSKYQEGDVVLA